MVNMVVFPIFITMLFIDCLFLIIQDKSRKIQKHVGLVPPLAFGFLISILLVTSVSNYKIALIVAVFLPTLFAIGTFLAIRLELFDLLKREKAEEYAKWSKSVD